MTRILIVEPNEDERRHIRQHFADAGFDAAATGNGRHALVELRQRSAQVLIINWSLPDISGSELLDRARQEKADLRVLVLARNASGSLAAMALEKGADDFLAQPASDEELLARVRIALRRDPLSAPVGTLRVGPLRLDTLTHRASVDGSALELAPVEYRLMAYFMQYPGRVHSRQHLLERVWGRRESIGERTVDVHVRRLRALLEPHGCAQLLQTVRGFGYRFGD